MSSYQPSALSRQLTADRQLLAEGLAAIEKQRCAISLVHFLGYCSLQETYQAATGTGGIVPFELWPHIVNMARDIEKHQRNVLIKARQDGFSWLMGATAVHTCLFNERAQVLMLSQGELEAKSLIRKASIVYQFLPDFLKERAPLEKDASQEMLFAETQSRILALPSTKKAGHGETASLVIQDEAEFHEYISYNFEAIGPTFDAGGKIIMGSTVDKRKRQTFFKSVVRSAPQNGWNRNFWSWKVRPGRDQAWYERTENSIPEEDLMGLTPELYMEGNYPDTLEEALRSPRSVSMFDHDVLDAMSADAKQPILRDGIINIYQRWSPRGRYAAASDTSHGIGGTGDYHATGIIDFATGRVVADILTNEVEIDEFAAASVRMLRLYKEPTWAIEDNEWGIAAIRVAQQMSYRRLYYRKVPRVTKDGRVIVEEPGWHTSPGNRWEMWSELGRATNAGEITVYNKDGLGQFYDVIKNPAKNNKPEAVGGGHDDYPTMMAIALQMRQHVRVGEIKAARSASRW